MIYVLAGALVIGLPLLLLLTGSSTDMESEKFKRRYPHSYKLMQDAKREKPLHEYTREELIALNERDEFLIYDIKEGGGHES